MALKFPGAGYLNRAHIQDPHVKAALDDLANQIRAAHIQGNFSPTGSVLPPTTPVALNVDVAASVFTVGINHAAPPSGTRWRLQYSTDPSFQIGVIEEELAAPNWQKSLPSQHLYFRVAAKFLTSEISPWVYFGNAAQPTRIG